MQTVTLIGIDLDKHSFHVHCQDRQGNALLRKKFSRSQLATFRKPFTFKAAKDSFHRRVIQAIPSATHALHYPITPE